MSERPRPQEPKRKVKSIQFAEGRDRWGVITDPAVKRQMNRERIARERDQDYPPMSRIRNSSWKR